MNDRDLDELRRLGEELRATFSDERQAIAKLDHERLTYLSDQKRRIVERLAEIRANVSPDPEIKALFEALRVEARATALLASAANELVQAMLGRETTTGGYDRRANKTTTTSSLRIITAY